VPRLPENPRLEHLKGQAKALLERARARDEQALGWLREYHPDPPPAEAELRLADAQLTVARAYGFPSWPKLRAHLDVVGAYTRSPHRAGAAADPAEEFMRLACLTYSSDDPSRWAEAAAMLAERPELARASPHAAAAAGDAEAARELLGAAPGRANAQGGPHRWEPLLYLAYSRAAGDGALEVARLLLAAGADPNAGYLWEGLPSPFTVLTGAFGRGEGDPPPHRDGLALARLLLDAGADPNDTQATYNLSWTPGDEWLELLLAFGYGRGDGGPWHARLAPAHASPRENAEDCLTWAARHGFANRVRLLLDAGVDPDGRGTRHPILKGRTALGIAIHEGHVDVARLMLERGADVNARDRATALHQAALRGDPDLVELLLDHGADPNVHDADHGATPAGWAAYAGHEALAEHLRSREA
jgi:ankyrin repeat protein